MMKSCNNKNNPYFKDKTWTSSEETEFTTKPIKTHRTDCLLFKDFGCFLLVAFVLRSSKALSYSFRDFFCFLSLYLLLKIRSSGLDTYSKGAGSVSTAFLSKK